MIRKTIQLLLILFLLNSTLAAQSQFKSEWNVGVGFGPTFSSMSFEQPKFSTKSYQQFHGGIAIRYISEKNLGVIGELNYSKQGWKGNYKDNPEYESSHSLSYIELPILTHIYFGNKARFFINLGPKIQYFISEKEFINSALADAIAQDLNGIDSPHYYRKLESKFDYGILGGIGMELRTKIGNFSLEGRYYFGLGDIYDNDQGENNFSRSANRTISARLTYYVKLF